MRQLTLGSTAKNSSKSSGTVTQGPEIPILSIILLQMLIGLLLWTWLSLTSSGKHNGNR